MRTGVVCYVERSGGGTIINRVRLVGPGVIRSWTAPAMSGALASDAAGPGPAVHAAKLAARWIGESLASVGIRRLSAVCLDADGAVCAWLSSPSADAQVVRATIEQSAADGDGSGAGVGAARLLSLSSAEGVGGLMSDTTVQAIATLSPEPRKRLSLPGKAADTSIVQAKHRYAVLAVPDAPIRVLLDELDAKSIEVACAMSIWHAMADAWDQPTTSASRMGIAGVVESSPPGAVILVEPDGRLIWAWMRDGELVASGSMRLATRSRRMDPAASPVSALSVPLSSGPASAQTSPEAETFIDFTKSDAGRMAMDWLAWSAQLGHCPQRVVCLIAPNLTGGMDAESGQSDTGPEALVKHLAAVWPGATFDGATHNDPVGATLGRIAGIQSGDEPEVLVAARLTDVLPVHMRGRELLTGLSTRAGRADKRLHQWIALTLFALACGLGILAYLLSSSASQARERVDELRTQRRELLTSLEKDGIATNLVASPNPKEQLDGALNKLREQIRTVRMPKPVLSEVSRVLAAMEVVAPVDPPEAGGPAPTQLMELEVNAIMVKVQVVVPDAETGPKVLDALTKQDGVLRYQGQAMAAQPGASRQYVLTSSWPDDIRLPVRPAAPASKPTQKPAAPIPVVPPSTTPMGGQS